MSVVKNIARIALVPEDYTTLQNSINTTRTDLEPKTITINQNASDPIQIDFDTGTVFIIDKRTYTNSSISLINGSEGITYQLIITSNGNSYNFDNANLGWPNSSPPNPSGLGKIDIYSVVKVGTRYYGSYAFNFTP